MVCLRNPLSSRPWLQPALTPPTPHSVPLLPSNFSLPTQDASRYRHLVLHYLLKNSRVHMSERLRKEMFVKATESGMATGYMIWLL